MIVSRISAKTGDGKSILSHMEGEPYFFTFGKSEVPKVLEMGIGTMACGEKAVVYVTSQYLKSPLIPVIESFEEVHFEVELFHFIKVGDMLGDGRLIKRRIHDGKVYYMSIARACFLMKKAGSSMIQELTTMISRWSSVLEKGSPANVPEGANVQWEIELLGFEMPKDWTGLNFKSIMDNAEKIRLTGSRLC
ncbi:hypothetical protein CMV_002441 [Castanea mollissima]|uniref:peptidylprolyl isomerase n=1 Tax=Castanea mollissima TaxID=60419 RepID=A0A8J4RJ71_9ROSI|nr:hypothetical protein CMV_002441 [Castanea mollissima]